MSESLINNPFIDLLGVQHEHWEDGYIRTRLDLRPDHQNRSGVVHGGILTTLLDHVGSFSGLYCTTPRSRTLLRHSLPHMQLRRSIEKWKYRGYRPANGRRA